MRLFCCLAILTGGMMAATARADIELIGVGTLPGTTADLSGLTGKTSDGTPNNRLGGLGSGMTYTGRGNEYLLASDRGPKDGASDYACRFHRMNIVVDPKGKLPVTLKLTETKMLTDETGRKLVGSLDAIDVKRPEQSLRFDPEGVRLGREGTIFISDEYGPVLAEFNPQGKRIRSFPIPARFLPTKPGKTPADELPPLNTTGRVPNRGMEGLAISPDGTMLYGIMQSPLIQDGALDKDNARVGLNCRLLELDTVTKKSREFVYPLEDKGNGLSEILAINNQEFLVLERDSKGGKDAAFKKIYHINLAGATDVSAVAALPASELPSSIQPVKKTLFLDLLDKKFAIAGDECPEKFEGLAFGPDLPDGRRLLLVSADNDFIAEQPLRIYAFAIDPKQLPGFVPQQFSGR